MLMFMQMPGRKKSPICLQSWQILELHLIVSAYFLLLLLAVSLAPFYFSCFSLLHISSLVLVGCYM